MMSVPFVFPQEFTVLVNPAAGGSRALRYIPRLTNLFASRGISPRFILTKNAADLHLQASGNIARGAKLLVAMGGDGTFQTLVNAAFGVDVVLGILPCGGGNDVAAALGFRSGPIAAATELLSAQPRWIDLARARTADGRERLYAGGGGVGLDAEAMRYANDKFKKLPARLRYIAAALRALRDYQAVTIRAEFPGGDLQAVESQGLLVSVLNTPAYGGGLRLAPEARVDDGFLNLVMMDKLSAWQIAALLPRLVASGELRAPGIRRLAAQHIRLSTETPRAFQGDGEILGFTPVEISVVRKGALVLARLAR